LLKALSLIGLFGAVIYGDRIIAWCRWLFAPYQTEQDVPVEWTPRDELDYRDACRSDRPE
jgi:hypothetical protein